MNFDQVYQECMQLPAGKSKSFTLDQEPTREEMTSLRQKIADNAPAGTAVSLICVSPTQIIAHCHKL